MSGLTGTELLVEDLLARLRTELPAEESHAAIDAALATCRRLYGNARSRDALPLAQAALAHARQSSDHGRTLRAASACGNLCADMGDLVGAIEFHVQALRIASRDENRVEMSRSWGNIGVAIGISGNYAMAASCYRRSIALVEPQEGPVYSRVTACANLADACYQLGLIDEGISSGNRALREMAPGFQEQDPYGALLLRRNMVRLHIAAGNLEEAERHVLEASRLAEATQTPRARIAGDIVRASFELAQGRADIALTRLDQILARSREVPSTLRDTLICVIRAEDAAGNAARALIRLEELSDHIYDIAIARTREQLELAGLRSDLGPDYAELADLQRARLVSKLAPRQAPEGWGTLQRLAVGAVMRFDPTGWHGRRVGALSKALALATGLNPLQAVEFGMAAEVHDIGMLSVPEGLLAKNGPLSRAEHAMVERHVDAGAEMLRDDRHPLVFLAREIAKYNHAYWDGGGYPERVGGRFIPLAARVCAIADAYDSMVCGIGGPARTMSDALQELKLQAGRQFDPELVSCFDALIRSETEGLGVDLEGDSGMEDFQELVLSLKEDRGFV